MSATASKPLRWKIGARMAVLGIATIAWVRWREDWPFQKRNLISYEVGFVTGVALVIWWLFLSGAAWRTRWRVMAAVLACFALLLVAIRVRGVTGDLVPIAEWRWTKAPAAKAYTPGQSGGTSSPRTDFPQFQGPDRAGVLPGPILAANWAQNPPQEVWRRSIGAGWSGFVVVGDTCITQEQRGETECVSASALTTGEPRWTHTDPAHYQSLIAGEGPRATPTVNGDRVFTLGSTGLLNCLELASGRRLWCQDVVKISNGKVPEWGATSSPLVVNDLVIVHGGQHGDCSLLAFRTSDGGLAWKAGGKSSYSTPVLATLAGVQQVLAFNDGSVSAHDPRTGKTLWQRPWGNGNVVCASPVVVGGEHVLFSSGYGVGAELLKVIRKEEALTVESLWQSTRMKSKFANLFVRDGCVFGLDDGILACADLKDGSRHWREGRYGHGQGLVIGEHYVLMAESGDLVLLHPTPEAPNELARLRVLTAKTWNPLALAGDLLLVRNDREAVCLRLPLAK